MLRHILDDILTAEQRQGGLYLVEDEDSLYLKRDEGILAKLGHSASPETIRRVAELYREQA